MIMKKNILLIILCGCSYVYSMEEGQKKREVYTSKSMVSAIKNDKALFIEHLKNNIEIKNYVLVALFKKQDSGWWDTLCKYSPCISQETLNEFVEWSGKNASNQCEAFFDVMHRIIGATGLLPTEGNFKDHTFYKNAWVQWYLKEIVTGKLTQQEIDKLQTQMIKELEGYEKDLKNGEEDAYDSFFVLGHHRLGGLIEDNKEIKENYYKKWGKELAYDVVKYFRPSGPLISALFMAIATGNKEIVKAICQDSSLLMMKTNAAPLYLKLYELCYKKNHVSEIQTGNNQNVQQGILQSLDNIASTIEATIELMVYGVMGIKNKPLFYGAFKTACLYQQLDSAKLLIGYIDCNDTKQIDMLKKNIDWMSGVIEYLSKKSELVHKHEQDNLRLHQKQLTAFITMQQELKAYFYCLRRFAEVKERIGTLTKGCTLPLLDDSKQKIIVPAEIGLKILEYCPKIYKKIELKKKN